ncbi:adenosine kinase isoform X2 [Trichoplusia ni]|uniref:Adenosine kinase n=1 Tax=Trichoplusia ni TaxID=7111 RepID=A0A7E5WMF2_TRINI|nr:adenosine kinase isoform X2 [Trichoplusia ni]
MPLSRFQFCIVQSRKWRVWPDGRLLSSKAFNSLPENLLIGMGNPLLDISAVVDESVLQKYDLKPNDAIMADAKHMPLYKELTEKYNAEYIAGGSVQNSLRVIQWLIKKPKVCTYFGCVGDDKFAQILKERASADGVNVMYQVNKEHPTGTCAVLVTGQNRSLCANLAAAQKFTDDHLSQEECKKAIESAKFFYTSGFFVAVSPESMMRLAKHSLENKQTFVFNVSAAFVSQFYKEPLEKLLPYVDLFFGNLEEAKVFAKDFDFKGTTIEEIALEISRLPKMDDRPRVVVITQGNAPVVLVENGKVIVTPVKPLSTDEIVDTNGAGDAFTGGFLAQLLLGKPYTECVNYGIYAARHVIQHSGCTFTGESEYKED